MKKPRWFSKWMTVPVIIVMMFSAIAIGSTLSSFNDSETSNTNTSSAWTSANWTQTSQTDFEAGVPSSVDTLSSSGNVSLQWGGNAGGNLILLWDTGTVPTGWTDVSASGQPFNNVFPRGAATYGGTGGTGGTHSHTVTLVSIGPPSVTANFTTGSTTRASGTHTHTLSSSTTGTVSNLPSYKNLRVIKYTSGVPTFIPSGAIAIFDAAAPTGWTRYTAQDNFFVQGAATTGGTGGTNTDSHTVPNLANNTATVTVTSAGSPASGAAHNHTFANTTSMDKRPPYIEVILAKANSNTAIPAGMIGMFDATPGGGWSVLSGTGGPFDSRFIVGMTSYGATGGAASHTPTGPSTTLAESGSVNANTGTPTINASVRPHTHSVTLSFNSVSNLPPYIDVIIAKASNYPSSGTVASQVLDTTVTGSRWDGLAWDKTLPASTNITFEVRASDTAFLKTDATPSWTSVGGTSPVISGLPSGRYKQWRATLTPDGTRTSTPILQEVRVYYYGG